MDNMQGTPEARAKSLWNGILDTVKAVITNPAQFYRTMPKTGGFGDPLVFMAVLGVIAGVIQAVFGLFHIGFVGTTLAALGAIIMAPVVIIIAGFIGAAIVFVIWKLMGSAESYETAYRCLAYAGAIAPITALFNLIPYVGGLVGLAWGLFLLVTASVEVHKIAAKTAWLVFGIIAAILAIGSISAQRRAASAMGAWQHATGKTAEEMTPDDAGRAAAAFLKAMQNEAAKQEKAEKKNAETE